jgi:hypothetical protein
MNTTLKPASFGSVSHGTLRNVDLLDSLAKELEWQIQRNGDYFSLPENREESQKLDALKFDALELSAALEDGTKEDGETASEMVNTLSDTLGQFAPPYGYFGSHVGDGSDFGFWPDFDSVEELEKFEEKPEELPGDDFVVVNERGNMTLYAADGVEIWAIV